MKNLIITLFSCSVIAVGVYSFVAMENDSLRGGEGYSVTIHGTPVGSSSPGGEPGGYALPVYKGAVSGKAVEPLMGSADYNTTIARSERSVEVRPTSGTAIPLNLFGESGGGGYAVTSSTDVGRRVGGESGGTMSLLAWGVPSGRGASSDGGSPAPGLQNRLERMSGQVSTLDAPSTQASSGSILPPSTGDDDDDLIELPLTGGEVWIFLVLSLLYVLNMRRRNRV